MKKKTIIHVAPFAVWIRGKGKAMPSVYLPVKGLADNGYDNIYITDSPYASPEDDSESAIKVIRINNPLAYTKFSRTRIYCLLIYFPIIFPLFIYHAIKNAKKSDVAVVYSHTPTMAFLGYILSLIFKAKHVVRFYGIGLPNKKWYKGLLLRQSFWYPADLYIIADDGSNGYEYAIKRGVPPDKIAFVRNGIDKVVNLVKDESLYKELAPNNEKLLLSVSRLDENTKNIDKIIEAFHGVSKILTDTRLVIVGDGRKRKELEIMASGLGISDRISFVGIIDRKEVYRYHSVADIFISMNEISSLSNAVYEAMSCGKCVIALDRGATRELIKDGENGVVIESCEKLKDAIVNVFSDPDMIARLGREAKKTVDAFPSWDERVQWEIRRINELCENKM